ncbi:MAG: hypothetical protein AAGA30_16660, partial [Planctomycetota bacterium]
INIAMKLSCFSFLCIALLPYLYLNFVTDWGNPDVLPIANWIGAPVALFTVPLVSFIRSNLMPNIKRREKGQASFLILSIFEVLILTPAWVAFWILLEVSVLGWVLL